MTRTVLGGVRKGEGIMRDVDLVPPPGQPPKRSPQDRRPRKLRQASEGTPTDPPVAEMPPALPGEAEQAGHIDVRV